MCIRVSLGVGNQIEMRNIFSEECHSVDVGTYMLLIPFLAESEKAAHFVKCNTLLQVSCFARYIARGFSVWLVLFSDLVLSCSIFYSGRTFRKQ